MADAEFVDFYDVLGINIDSTQVFIFMIMYYICICFIVLMSALCIHLINADDNIQAEIRKAFLRYCCQQHTCDLFCCNSFPALLPT